MLPRTSTSNQMGSSQRILLSQTSGRCTLLSHVLVTPHPPENLASRLYLGVLTPQEGGLLSLSWTFLLGRMYSSAGGQSCSHIAS